MTYHLGASESALVPAHGGSQAAGRRRGQALAVALWVAPVLALIPASARPQGVDVRPSNITLVDANSKQIGTVVGADPTRVTVALTLGGRGVLLATPLLVGAPELVGMTNVGFTGPDCTGTALVEVNPKSPVPRSGVTPPGITVYLGDPTTPPTQFLWKSAYSFLGGSATCGPDNATRLSVVVAPIVDLLTVFTPPLRLVFTATPSSVPTLSDWALVLMVGVLGGSAVVLLRRRLTAFTVG
jgi:hypothetical protein